MKQKVRQIRSSKIERSFESLFVFFEWTSHDF